MLRKLAALVAACAVLAVTGCGGTAAGSGEGAGTVQVAAAASLRFVLEEVREAMAEQDPPVEVVPVYASSGQALQQIRNGAPYDVFLSAESSFPAELVAEGEAEEADLFQYAVGRLVMWVPNDSPLDLTRGLELLADPAVTTVAIANPEHAPYGVAAVEAMRSAGVYDEVEDKLVTGENVAQAGEFAVSGNADIGIVALALAVGETMVAQGRYEEVPPASFNRIDQSGVVLTRAQDPVAARALRDFILSAEGAAILEQYGFGIPDNA